MILKNSYPVIVKHGLFCDGCYILPDFLQWGYCIECPRLQKQIESDMIVYDGHVKMDLRKKWR